jgi:hypothetical protein
LAHKLSALTGRTFKIDLVLYNRILKCFVLIDLKRGEVQHEDIGQMNFYLNYCREEMNTEGDTEPIGIVLGTDRDKLVMKYALQNITNQVFVSRYQLYLPDKAELEAEFRRFMGTDYECEETESEDDEAAAVVKDWCIKNNIQFIDDMDRIEETYRAIYM